MPWSLVSDRPQTFDDLGPYYKYNPAESKRLRIEAGLPDGKIKVETPIMYGNATYHVPRVLVLQQVWKAQGIEIDLIGADSSTYKNYYYVRGHKDLALTFQNATDYTLNWYAQNKYRVEGYQNAAWIDDPEVNKVINAIKTELDPAKQKEYARFLWDYDTLGSYNIWMPAEPTYSITSLRVRNHVPRTFGRAPPIWLADAPRTSP
jgi:ABC-type transport system substrate-binding protein